MTRKDKPVKKGGVKKSPPPKSAGPDRPAGGRDLLRKVPKLQKIKTGRGS